MFYLELDVQSSFMIVMMIMLLHSIKHLSRIVWKHDSVKVTKDHKNESLSVLNDYFNCKQTIISSLVTDDLNVFAYKGNFKLGIFS